MKWAVDWAAQRAMKRAVETGVLKEKQLVVHLAAMKDCQSGTQTVATMAERKASSMAACSVQMTAEPRAARKGGTLAAC